MSSSSSSYTGQSYIPVNALLYRDVGSPAAPFYDTAKSSLHEDADDHAPALSAQDIESLIAAARAEAMAEAENRFKLQARVDAEEQAARIAHTIEQFQDERKDYFARVESDVVHLALAIAAKILHREAQVDPMLVAGLVRVAIDKLHDGSKVSVRVCPSESERWRKYLATPSNGSTVTVVEDENLTAKDCILETDLGSASFSMDAQLKEIEKGFFDLLAQRPAIK